MLDARLRTILMSPDWRLRAGGVPAALDIDFARGRANLRGKNVSISSLLTCSRATTGSYRELSGSLRTFNSNDLRRSSGGVLAEPAATNLVAHPEDDNNNWQLVAVTRGTLGVAPDGNTTAQLYVATAPNTGHTVQIPAVTVVNATVYTYSIFGKYSGSDSLTDLNTDSFGGVISFNTKTGVVGWASPPVGGSVVSTAWGNGWYRAAITWTTTSTSKAPTFYLGTYGSAAGDGVNGNYIWGADCELGEVATSYIPLALGTRAQDNITMLVSAIPGFNASAGTLFAQYTLGGVITTNSQAVCGFYADDSNRITLNANNTAGSCGLVIASAAGSFCDVAGASTSRARQAGAWATNDASNVLNGGSPSTDSSVTVPTVTTLIIGAKIPNAHGLIGTVDRVSYWDFRAPDVYLQALSSPSAAA